MTTYIQATPRPPTIVCPAWCTVPAEYHLAELRQQDGMVIHHSAALVGTVAASSSNFPDGTPDPDEGPRIYSECGASDMSIDEAEQLARNILSVVAIVRGAGS